MSTVLRGATVPAPRPHVQAFADAIFEKFGTPSGTYNGHDPTPDRALDTFASKAQGDGIVQFGIANWDLFGLMYHIWRQMINSQDGRGWRWMGDRGSPTQNHMDHVHDSFNEWGPAVPGTSEPAAPALTCEEQIWMQGDEGDCVIGIQDHLNRYDAGLVVDGDYGPATRAAVTKFQQVHGLAPDGVVGLKTWPVLISGVPTVTPIAPPRPVPPTPNVPPLPRMMWKGMSGPDVRQVQERLHAHGADITIDGDFGPQTRAKTIIHQAAWRLDADGVVGPDTWATLWVDLP
jgi:hypothetical protein